jgi:hypothetical protein
MEVRKFMERQMELEAVAAVSPAVRQWKGSHDVATVRYGRVLLVLRENECGKPNCHKCPHGPYWYLVYYVRGKPKTVYIGKSLEGRRLEQHTMAQAMVREIQRTSGVPSASRDAYRAYLAGARWGKEPGETRTEHGRARTNE